MAPTSLVLSPSLDCSLCQADQCDGETNNPVPPAPHNIYFVRRVCAQEELPGGSSTVHSVECSAVQGS